MRDSHRFKDLFICANSTWGTELIGPRDTCQGDSGGPLTVKNEDNAHTLIGIVSKMLPLDTTCKDQEYAVFTSIAGFLPWIKASIKDNGGMASCDASFSVPPSKGGSNDQTKNTD